MVRTLDDVKINKDKFYGVMIDAMNVVKKFYHIHRNFQDSKGRKTGIIYGVLNFIYFLKQKHNGIKAVMLWDTRAEKKKSVDENYKANRKHEELSEFWEQVRNLKIALSYYGVRQYYADGYEADDVVSRLLKDNKDKMILLVSSDNDWDFLLGDKVFILRNNEIYSREDIQKGYEYPIERMPLYKSVMGEGGDNILKPIKRFPKKIMIEIVNKCENLNDMFLYCQNNLNEWTQAILDNQRMIKNNFYLSKMIDNGYEIQKIEMNEDKNKLLYMLKDYEMKKLTERIENE